MRTHYMLLALLGIASLLGAGCAAPQHTPADAAGAVPISATEPPRGEFSARPEPVPLRPAVASSGGCEPRYANGRSGTCIGGKPCRGFGVLEDGRAVCMCYGTRGGCAEGFRCDTRGAQCVKDGEGEFNRAR